MDGRLQRWKVETYLFVKFDESWFELLLDVLAEVVGELVVGVGLAGIVLVLRGKVYRRFGDSVERDIGVLGIAYVLKFNVGDLLVADNGGVVGDDVAW